MPTTRPRHTITETPEVKDALDRVRERLPKGQKVDYAELLMLGAEVKARRLGIEEAANRAARERLGEMIRTGSFPWKTDFEAAEEVKRSGWTPHVDVD